MIIYALFKGNHPYSYADGYNETLEGAKQRAQETIDEWWEYVDGLSEKEKAEVEPMTTRTLEWEPMFHYISEPPKPAVPENDNHRRFTSSPYPTAFFSEKGHFYIREIEVGP